MNIYEAIYRKLGNTAKVGNIRKLGNIGENNDNRECLEYTL